MAAQGDEFSGRETLGADGEILLPMSTPPGGLPIYRVVTGPDDAAFCHRVSEVIGLGYEPHEGPPSPSTVRTSSSPRR